jgi:hypothetical protein
MFLYAEADSGSVDLAVAERAIPFFEGIWLAGAGANFSSVRLLETAERMISVRAPSLTEQVDISRLPRLRNAHVSEGLESALRNPGVERLRLDLPSVSRDLEMPSRLSHLAIATDRLESFPSLMTERLETVALYVPRGTIDLSCLVGATRLRELTLHCRRLHEAQVLRGLGRLRSLSLVDVRSVEGIDLLELTLDFFMANRNYLFDDGLRAAAEARFGVCVIGKLIRGGGSA